MHFIARRLQVIRELDQKVSRGRFREAEVGAADPIAFRWNIAWRVGVRCVPDHSAIEQQPFNFLGGL